MPSFADSIFLFVLALLLFGPKKLPVLARELGKWMGEFRRASNEFKMQMEDELRASEQADRQKQIAAMEAAAPVSPPVGQPPEPEHPHLRHHTPSPEDLPDAAAAEAAQPVGSNSEPSPVDTPQPQPIATSGSLHMMPPATGLPTPRSARSAAETGLLTGLVDAIPEVPHTAAAALAGEEVAHAD